MNTKTCVIIPAGGVGQRTNLDMPKQFHKLLGKPLIIYSLEKFEQNENIDAIIIACHKDWLGYMQELIDEYNITKVSNIVEGGASRQESVYEALKSDNINSYDIIMVHDAVRIFVDDEIINDVLEKCEEFGVAIPVVNLSDTVKFVENNIVQSTPDRNSLRAVQTPQASKTKLLLSAYDKCKDKLGKMTDDSAILELAGYEVAIAKGKPSNFKITNESDLAYAEFLLNKD